MNRCDINDNVVNLEQTSAGWECNHCRKENLKFANFCGKCGLPKANSKTTLTTSEKMSKFFHETFYARFCRLKHLIPGLRKTAISSIVFGGLLGASLFGIKELSATQEKLSTIRWGRVRSYISKTYRLTNSELDLLLGKIMKNDPAISDKINANQMISLESAIRGRLQDSRVRLFPNPFFSEPDRIINVSDRTPSQLVFTDISLDHPAYSALKSLFAIGIFCGDDELKMRPYEKISWQDWSNVSNQFAQLISVNSEASRGPESIRKGLMSNYELNGFFNGMREQLGMQKKETFAWSSEPVYLSRLEAFAALSSLIKELE